jgi:two-component sensor histidine kinase
VKSLTQMETEIDPPDGADSSQAASSSRCGDQLYRSICDGMDQGFYFGRAIFDELGQCVDIHYLDENAAAIRMNGGAVRGRLMSELARDQHGWRASCGAVARTGRTEHLQYPADVEGGSYDVFVFKPAAAGADEFAVIFREPTSAETKLRESQQRERLLRAELQYRVRAILALVRSVIRRTMVDAKGVDAAHAHLSGRIDAMARIQGLLTRAADGGVNLEALVRDELLAQAFEEDRLRVVGPAVALSAKAAEVLGLLVHELATNATKYGANAQPDGLLAVTWEIQPQAGSQAWLNLRWIESGVSIASAGARKPGFGTELVTRRLPYELKGKGALEFFPGGVRVEVSFPLVDGDSILQPHASQHAQPET